MGKIFYHNRIEDASHLLFYFLYGFVYSYSFIPTTFLQFGDLTFAVTLIFSIVTDISILYAVFNVALNCRKAYLQKDRSQFSLLILQVMLAAATCLFWIKKGYTDKTACIMLMVLPGISAKGKRSSTILRIALIIGTALTVLCFVLSMTGIIDNNRGNSYGFIYRTDYACHLLFLMLIYCFYYSGYLSWQGELGILALTLYNFFFVGGKTADICMLLVISATYLRHYFMEGCVPFQTGNRMVALQFRILYLPCVILDKLRQCVIARQTGKKTAADTADITTQRSFPVMKDIFHRCCVLSFLLFAAVMVSVTLLYHLIPVEWFKAVPKLATVRARLILGMVGFDIYPVTLFGNAVVSRGAGGTETNVDFYYFLDSSYIKMLLEDGIVIFLVVLLIMTLLQLRLYRKKYFYECFLLAVAALDCAMEHHLTDLSYNMFGVLLFSTLDRPVPAQPVFGIRTRPVPTGSSKLRFRIGRVYALLSVLLMLAAFPTAHAITNWSGYAPASHAVLLLPGSYMEGYSSTPLQEKRVETAARYLSSHETAVCITSGAEGQELRRLLAECGIAESRIYVDSTSETLEAALLYADDLIGKEHLINRKTVCTFELEQARVKETAHGLGTPVNGLSVSLDGFDYARCFINEQLQLISCWIRGWLK